MSLITNILKQFSPPEHVQQKSISASFFSFLSPTAMPKMNEKEALKAYEGIVYACVNAIADCVSAIEISLEQRQKNTWAQVEDHPALQLLHKVNDFTSSLELLFLHEAYQQLSGNSFWYLPRKGEGKGDPAEIWLLNPTKVEVVKDEKTFIKGYVYYPEPVTRIPLTIEEVIHFKKPNPNDAHRGIGTVLAAGLAIDTDHFASEYQRNFFGNSASPSGIVSTEGSLTTEQFDRLKAQWDSKFKGVQNAHKVAVMEAGMKWTPTAFTAKEMQFSESRKDLRDEIMAIFRVPKTLLGITEDVNLASAQATEYIFAKYALKPRMQALITTLNEFYLPMWNLSPTQYRFNFTDPVGQNIEQDLQIIANGRSNGWMTKNEARERFGYKPRAGADELDESTMEQPIPGSDQPDDPAHTTQDEEEEEDVDEGEKSVKKNVTKGKPIERTEASKQKEQDYKQEQIAKFHKIYLGLNEQLKTKLLGRIQNYKAAEPHSASLDPYLKEVYDIFMKDTEKVGQADELVNWIFENDMFSGWVTAVYDATEEGLTNIVGDSGRATFADLQLEGSFDLSNPRAESFIKNNALRDTNSYSDTIKQSITDRLVTGVEQGLSNEKIADSISEYFTDKSDYQAMRMARYETITGYGAGNLEGFKQSGVVSKKYWIADSEACPICTENAEAGEIGLDEEFPSGDQHPENHPNGECSLGGTTDTEA